MSKNRLEEIRTRLKYGLGCLKHLRREILNSDDESLKDQINLLENDIKYLFEQAEQAQKNAHDLVDMNMQLKGAQRLNTRYHQALEEIANKRMTYADMFSAIRTAKEVLRDRERTNETIKFIRKH